MSVQIPESAYPLAWPSSWKRSSRPTESNFGKHSRARAVDELNRQLRLLTRGKIVVSTNTALRLDGLPYSNQPRMKDPGVAVYFTLKNRPVVLACDKWERVECNLWAIAKHIEALRGQERWGIGTVEQAFTGYMALPAPMVLKPWWEVLGLIEDCRYESALDRYRHLAKINHPDNGGDTANMAEINTAWDDAKLARGWK